MCEVINDINYQINNMAISTQQLQQNIDALEQQGAPKEDIQ